jgi:hypothetical protein
LVSGRRFLPALSAKISTGVHILYTLGCVFEYREEKRQAILRDRGLDLRDAALLFDGRAVVHVESRRNNEDRFLTIGEISGKF